MKTVLILISLLFTFQSFGQGNGWEWQNPKPQGNTLKKICFVDTLHGWILGEYGTILRTTDGGMSWTNQTINKSTHLISASFIDSSSGWVLARFIPSGVCYLYHTTNGGTTWSALFTSSSTEYNAVFFTDHQHGFMVGDAAIYKTEDGGVTWNLQPAGVNASLTEVFFITPQIGWVAPYNSNKILKTTNGGNTWTASTMPIWIDARSIQFIDTMVGWIAASRTVFKTVDGGEHWQSVFTSPGSYDLESVSFIGAKGWVVGENCTIYRSLDSGSTWTECSAPDPIMHGITRHLNSVFFTNESNGIAVGSFGTFFYTQDGGATWQTKYENLCDVWDIFFMNSQVGYCSGINGIFDIYKTVNGGDIWTRLPDPFFSFNHYAMYFISENVGWFTDQDSFLLKTVDGGNSWIKQNYGLNLDARSLYFLDDQTGWAVGNTGSGAIMKTKDGVNTWVNISNGIPFARFYSVFFTDTLHGFVGGENGRLYRTVDGGATWTMNTVGGLDVGSIHFVNSQVGWFLTSNLYKTVNGGNTWTNQPFGLVSSIGFVPTEVRFVDSQNGYVSAEKGRVLRTTNGGTTWTEVSTPSGQGLRGIFFTDPNNGWVVGEYGTILHTSTGGLPVANKTLVSSPTFSLYPNPTLHLCHLQTTSIVLEATVVDGLGRTHLSIQNPGKTLDLKELASGLYWVKVKTADGVTTQRVVKE